MQCGPEVDEFVCGEVGCGRENVRRQPKMSARSGTIAKAIVNRSEVMTESDPRIFLNEGGDHSANVRANTGQADLILGRYC